jgi:hypothetical protein
MGQANRERRRLKEKERKRARAAGSRQAGAAPGTSGAFGGSGASGPFGGPDGFAQAAAAMAEQWLSPVQPPSPKQLVAAIVSAASQAYFSGDRRDFDAAVAALVEHPDLGGWRVTAERSISTYLLAEIGQAWQRGWQPADLARVVGRQLGAQSVRLVRDAIAAELQSYPAATLDPRWQAQLAELEARVWWPAEQNLLRAWCALPGNDWVEVIPRALEVFCLVHGLAELEQLGPLPGTARPPRSKTEGDRPPVDERMLSRVRALLAKAEATTSEAEAEAFTAGAQERMARHSIDLAMLAATEPDGANKPIGRRIGIDNPYEASKAVLLDAVSRANRCRSVWSQHFSFCTVIGFEPDLDAVETLFTSLLVQAITAMTRAGSRTGVDGRSRTRAFRQSFLAAYATRIGERLAEVIEVQTEAASAEPGGGNLLPVLASRNQAVDAALSSMFPSLTHKSAGSIRDAEGWHSGRGAADLATLSVGKPLPE